MTHFALVHLEKETKGQTCCKNKQTNKTIPRSRQNCWGSNLVADDLPLHGHTQAGERAVAHQARHNGLAAFGLSQLVGLGLTAVQRLRGEEAHVAVATGDDGQQLLLQHQVDVVHFLVVAHADDLCGDEEGEESRKVKKKVTRHRDFEVTLQKKVPFIPSLVTWMTKRPSSLPRATRS